MSDNNSGDASNPSKKRLGKGLAALIGDMDMIAPQPAGTSQAVAGQPSGVNPDRLVPIDHILPNPNNPRKDFVDADLSDLSASIKEHGIMQPIIVRSDPNGVDGRFEIIAGERRWRAAQRAALHNVPVLVREVDDKASLELAIVENVQRADLNPVEEALGYQRLMDDHEYTQNDLGQVIGKSRSHVANTLRLLKLPTGVLEMVAEGSLSAGHARTLVTADNPLAVAKAIVKDGLSVRQAEKLAQGDAPSKGNGGSAQKTSNATKDADTLALEKALSDGLGFGVNLDHSAAGDGTLSIKYKSLEQLDQICRLLKVDF